MHFPIALITFHAGWSHSSLALRSLKAFCADEPFADAIRLHEAQENADPFWLLEEVAAGAPRLAGFSTYLWNIERSLSFAARLKQLLPECIILLGGPEAGPRGEELLAAHPFLDFVVDGEGEEPFREIARLLWSPRLGAEIGTPGPRAGLQSLAAIPGLIRRDGETIRRNPPRPLRPEELRSPILGGTMDSLLDDPRRGLIYWETSRGCPFRCSFCTSAEDRLRMLPEERVLEELAYIEARLGDNTNRTIKLLDRSFHLGRERTLRLLRRFVETPSGLRFHLELNPDRISHEAMELFRAAPPGKFQFEIGLQSLEPEVLHRIDREMQVAKGLANIAELAAMGRHPVHLDLIVGLPDETAEQCRADLDRTFRLHADHLQLGLLKLLPGTPLRRDAARWGYRWDRTPPYAILGHRRLSFGEIALFRRYAELLERLWNSELIPATLMHLVEQHHRGSLCRFLDHLLTGPGERMAVQRASPETLLRLMGDYLEPLVQVDPLLRTLFLWDCARQGQPHNDSPNWVRQALAETRLVQHQGVQRRLPLLRLDTAAAALIGRRRLDSPAPGGYVLWLQKHQKGAPALAIPVDSP